MMELAGVLISTKTVSLKFWSKMMMMMGGGKCMHVLDDVSVLLINNTRGSRKHTYKYVCVTGHTHAPLLKSHQIVCTHVLLMTRV